MLSLRAQTRARLPDGQAAGKKIRNLREDGQLPAVFYGAGRKAGAVAVNAKEFLKIWREAGESGIVTLATPEGDLNTLIYDVQLDPVSDRPIHADFLIVDVKKEIEVKVPLEFEGVSEAVKSGLGSLVKVLHEVEIRGLPGDLPHSVKVDISPLKTLEDKITVADLALPAGVKAAVKGSDIVALVRQIQEEKEETPVDLSQIEISEKRGKEEAAEGEVVAAAETKPAAKTEKK